jgi:TRAP transporter TAXI family solute receptor
MKTKINMSSNMSAAAIAGLTVGVLTVGSLTLGTASAKTLLMATDRTGTLYYATGSALSKVLTTKSGHRVVVRAFGGPDSYIHGMNRGEYDFTAVSSNSAWFNYNGKTRSKKKTRDLRLVRSGGGALKLGFLVYNDSDIKTVAQVRGRKVVSDFGGHAAVGPIVTAALGSAGLTWKDVQPVKVTGVFDAPKALGAGRVDVAWGPIGMPAIREIHAKKKVRFLSFQNTPEALALFRKRVFPGVRLTTMPPIKHLGLQSKTTLLTSDSYLLTHKNIDKKILNDVLEAMWDNEKEIQKSHFSLRGFSNKNAATDLPVMPYHPAAIAFYKKKDVWTKEIAAKHGMIK